MFKSILEGKGVRTFVRRPRGRDIFAACGQLAAVTQTGGVRGVSAELLDWQTA
jgi:adenine C2-methylase RlmN of 23S rRNA A2503 and tRNA A37